MAKLSEHSSSLKKNSINNYFIMGEMKNHIQ